MPSLPLVFAKPASPSASSTSLTSSATSTTSAKPASAAGSRSKRTKSGRSGLSTREYHVFRSMQPMFTIQSSASSSLTIGRLDLAAAPGRVAGRDLELPRRDPVGHVLGRVLLEEVAARDPVGIALHRERPVLQVRQQDGRNRAVVGEQVALRDPVVREEDLVEVGELERAASRGAARSAAAPRGGPPARSCPRAAPGTTAPAAGRRASTRRTRPRRPAPASPRPRPPCAPSASSGRHGKELSFCSSGRSFASSSSITLSVKPVPTLPA